MRNGLLTALSVLLFAPGALAHGTSPWMEEHPDDTSFYDTLPLWPEGCQTPTAAQRAAVNQGNQKAAEFLRRCQASTGNSNWCREVMRPNPSSRATFNCTYGEKQPHQLIHPSESTWANAFKAVQLVRDLEALGVKVAQIYNWWRPEPYNANVGGAKGRHPYGTSVDVRFASLNDMEKAHRLLCDFRRRGRLRALGYYGSTGLHLGIGDSNPNTWGKPCP